MTPETNGRGPLSPTALAFRAAHAAIAIGFLAAIADVWTSALTRRRGPLVRVAVAALVAEGIVVTANGGDCPLGPLQARCSSSCCRRGPRASRCPCSVR